MSVDPTDPLIVQRDTLLPDAHGERAAVMPFAGLEKSPEYIHTCCSMPLWNAANTDGADELPLASDDRAVMAEIAALETPALLPRRNGKGFSLRLMDRGGVKRELIMLGCPMKDEAPRAAFTVEKRAG